MNNSKDGFLEFLNDNNIMATIVATIVSQRITDLSNAFIDYLVIPIFNRDADGDGEADIKDIKNYQINISGIKFKIGEFAVVTIKFLIIIFLVYHINKLMNKLKNR